jgi:heme-degrading monooxygenase HmoA
MPYLHVRHKVEDYERWKPISDEHRAVRQESGSKGGRLFRNADDPNETVILFEWDDLDKARTFAQSQDLRETMQRAGVTDQPDIYYFEEVEEVRV